MDGRPATEIGARPSAGQVELLKRDGRAVDAAVAGAVLLACWA
ncbi:hypothetical protein [Streptomyces sp. NPDC056527]